MNSEERKAIKSLLMYFDSGNSVPVTSATIRSDCKEIQDLRALLDKPQEVVAWIVDGGKKNGRLLYQHEYEFDLVVDKIMCKPLVLGEPVVHKMSEKDSLTVGSLVSAMNKLLDSVGHQTVPKVRSQQELRREMLTTPPVAIIDSLEGLSFHRHLLEESHLTLTVSKERSCLLTGESFTVCYPVPLVGGPEADTQPKSSQSTPPLDSAVETSTSVTTDLRSDTPQID